MLSTCYLEVSTKPSSTINAFYIGPSAIYHVSATTFFLRQTNQPANRQTKRVNKAPVGEASPKLKKVSDNLDWLFFLCHI